MKKREKQKIDTSIFGVIQYAITPITIIILTNKNGGSKPPPYGH